MSLTSSTANHLRKVMATGYGNVKETECTLDIRQGSYRLVVLFTRSGAVKLAYLYVDDIQIRDVRAGRNKLGQVEDLLEHFALRVAQELPADEIVGERVRAAKASMAADREAEAERAKAGAEALAKATGSVSATFVVERRHLDGTLERVAEETWVAPRTGGGLPDHVVEGIAEGRYRVVTQLDDDVPAAPAEAVEKMNAEILALGNDFPLAEAPFSNEGEVATVKVLEVCSHCATEIRRKADPSETVDAFGSNPIRDRCELCDGTFVRPWPASRMAFRATISK